MSLSKPHPMEPYSKTGVKLGDEQFAIAGEWERPVNSPWSVSASNRAWWTSSRDTRQTSCSARSRNSASGMVRTWSSTDTTCPELFHLDHDRGVPEPADDLREGPGLVHHATVQRT